MGGFYSPENCLGEEIWWDKELDNKKQIKIEADAPAWTLFRTKDGLPGSNPPWGYVVKQSLKTGKIIWKTRNISINEPGILALGVNPIIENNSIIFNSSALPSLNDSANLTLYNTTGINRWPFRDNISCPPEFCTELLDAQSEYIFNVSSLGNYNYSAQGFTPPCNYEIDDSGPVTMTADILGCTQDYILNITASHKLI